MPGYRFAEAVLEFELPDEYPAMAQPMVTAKLPEGPIADCLSLAR